MWGIYYGISARGPGSLPIAVRSSWRPWAQISNVTFCEVAKASNRNPGAKWHLLKKFWKGSRGRISLERKKINPEFLEKGGHKRGNLQVKSSHHCTALKDKKGTLRWHLGIVFCAAQAEKLTSPRWDSAIGKMMEIIQKFILQSCIQCLSHTTD